MTTVAELTAATGAFVKAPAPWVRRCRRSPYTPNLPSPEAEHNLYARIEAEFGMLTSTEAGKRMGSGSSAPRNLATTAHRNKALVAVRRGNYLAYPGFQCGPDGQPIAVIRRLRDIAETNDWSEAGLVQCLCSPTTHRQRPARRHLTTDPDRVVAVAAEALAVSW